LSKSETKTSPINPLLVLGIGILAVSTASLFIRYAQTEASSLTIAASRLTLAALFLMPVALKRNGKELAKFNRRQIGLLLLAGVFLAIHFASWITSLQYTTVASSVVLVATSPLWVALLSPLILRERLVSGIWIGLIITLLGASMVGISNACQLQSTGLICSPIAQFIEGRAFLGNSLALLGALMSAGYLLIGRRLRSTVSLVSYTFMVYGTAAVVLLMAVFLTGQKVVGFSPLTYVWFLALAIIPQLIGHSSFNWALKYLSAAYISVALLGEPIGSSLLAYVFLTETPSIVEILGGVMILIGIYQTSRAEQKN
jgi:drug/metabolite transporter (DMT)-like permease